jgi:hypothetical protein
MKISMSMKTVGLCLAMFMALNWTLAASATRAQVPGVPFELPGPPEKRPEAPTTFTPILTDAAVPEETGKWTLQPTFGYSFAVANFNRNWAPESTGGSFRSFGMSYKLVYGLMKNTEVNIVIPFFANWATNVNGSLAGPGGERAASSSGLGDINLQVKYQLVQETSTWPTITATFINTYPTGRFRGLSPSRLGTDVIGGGSTVFTPGLNVSKVLRPKNTNPFILYGNFWYSMPTAFTDDDARWYPRDFVTVNLAAEYMFNGKWVGCLDFTSHYDAGRLFGRKSNVSPTALVSLSPEIQYIFSEKLMFAAGVSFDLAGKNNTRNITPLFSIIYNF